MTRPLRPCRVGVVSAMLVIVTGRNDWRQWEIDRVGTDPLAIAGENEGSQTNVGPEVPRHGHLYLGMLACEHRRLRLDPFGKYPGEQKIRDHHETLGPEAPAPLESLRDERPSDATERHLHERVGPAFVQQARDLEEVRIGVGVRRAPADKQDPRALTIAH